MREPSNWQRFEEPLGRTLFRTILIAVIVGGVISILLRQLSRWPLMSLVAFLPSFGGHWIEVWFLNWLRPRITPAQVVQAVVRIVVWFLGGAVLALTVRFAAPFFGQISPRWLTWWLGGGGFVGIELAMHLMMQLRGLASFFNGRG